MKMKKKWQINRIWFILINGDVLLDEKINLKKKRKKNSNEHIKNLLDEIEIRNINDN